MAEVGAIAARTRPHDQLLVVDAMTGQDAVRSAKAFHERLALTGVILTKLDGDARGGAALSIKAVVKRPILFAGVGEKLEDLDAFQPRAHGGPDPRHGRRRRPGRDGGREDRRGGGARDLREDGPRALHARGHAGAAAHDQAPRADEEGPRHDPRHEPARRPRPRRRQAHGPHGGALHLDDAARAPAPRADRHAAPPAHRARRGPGPERRRRAAQVAQGDEAHDEGDEQARPRGAPRRQGQEGDAARPLADGRARRGRWGARRGLRAGSVSAVSAASSGAGAARGSTSGPSGAGGPAPAACRRDRWARPPPARAPPSARKRSARSARSRRRAGAASERAASCPGPAWKRPRKTLCSSPSGSGSRPPFVDRRTGGPEDRCRTEELHSP